MDLREVGIVRKKRTGEEESEGNQKARAN